MSNILDKVQNSVKLALAYIDSGDFFRTPVKWLYALIAVLNVLFPLYMFYKLFQNFNNITAWQGIVFLLSCVVLLAGGFVIALLWWLRKGQLSSMVAAGDDFPVTPIMTHLIRTAGEACGFFVGVVLFVIALIVWFLAGSDTREFINIFLPVNGFVFLFLLPIFGFIIVLAARFNSEVLYALAATASNTKKIEQKHPASVASAE